MLDTVELIDTKIKELRWAAPPTNKVDLQIFLKSPVCDEVFALVPLWWDRT